MFPTTSNLLSPHHDDAWVIVHGAGARAIVSTNGPTLIADVQRALVSTMAAFTRGELPAAFKHVTVADYFARAPVRLTGRWDAGTARASMLLAAGTPDQIRTGWAEIYRRRFGPSLTGFALTAWLNEETMARRLRDKIDTDRTNRFVVEIPRDARLPAWGYAPTGEKTKISIMSWSL